MTSLCVSFVRMCSKPLFEDYFYVSLNPRLLEIRFQRSIKYLYFGTLAEHSALDAAITKVSFM